MGRPAGESKDSLYGHELDLARKTVFLDRLQEPAPASRPMLNQMANVAVLHHVQKVSMRKVAHASPIIANPTKSA